MLTISSQELQKQIGEAQIEAAKAPVIVTSHGRPRSVLMSVDEFVRLKELAGEPVVIRRVLRRLRLIGVLPIARYPGASNRRRFVDAVW